MKIPLMDPVAQYLPIKGEIDAAIQSVLDSGLFILGPSVLALEQEISAYLGTRFAVGVGSGTDALLLALRALRIGPGHEVIVPSYSFFATVEVVLRCGATPVFVDIDPTTYCLDVEQVRKKITRRTMAVVPVHLFGHPADMRPLLDLAARHQLHVIEDNAQAFGAEYRGQKTGSLGHVGCLSFFPSKNLGGLGDGGMVVTSDPEVAKRVRMLRNHGWTRKYCPTEAGYNSRLDEIQAAVLRVKLRHVDQWNRRRRQLARLYNQMISELGLEVQREGGDCRHVHQVYCVRVKNRSQVQRNLDKAWISSAVYYPVPLHLTEACSPYGYSEGDFPHAETASREALALPIYPEMENSDVQRVIEKIREVTPAPGQSNNFRLIRSRSGRRRDEHIGPF